MQSCSRDDEIFPLLLREIKKCPDLLYYSGNIGIVNDMPCVAIIGSREASEEALEKAFSYGRLAAEEGFVVVNGLAVGCDTRALQGALSMDGKCVAVLPCGLDEIYPKSNEGLAREIIEKGGCLISEYPAGTKPDMNYFIQRDRLQSGMCAGVVVVETGEQGGTMHTVKFARAQNRRLACYYSKLTGNAAGEKSSRRCFLNLQRAPA